MERRLSSNAVSVVSKKTKIIAGKISVPQSIYIMN